MEGLCTNVAIAKRLGLKSVHEVKNLSDDNEIWDMIGFYLGTFCANIYLTVSTERFILGGGIMMRKCLFPKIRQAFLNSINRYV